MSKQLLQAAINAKEALEYMYNLYGNADCRGNGMDEMLESSIEQLDAAIAIAQRQEQMQAADAYEAQFAPESFDSAEGSPICDGCGCEIVADYDGNDRIIGWDCMNCAMNQEPDYSDYQEPCDDCGRYHEWNEPCWGNTPYEYEWLGRDSYETEQYILSRDADERASEESYHWYLEGLYNSPQYLDYLAYLRQEWRI